MVLGSGMGEANDPSHETGEAAILVNAPVVKSSVP